jgi:hypothetical protein
MITDTASQTNTPPTITSVSGCCTMNAMIPMSPPSASEPVSPIKSSAGCELNQRNASPAPTSEPHTTVSSPAPGRRARGEIRRG